MEQILTFSCLEDNNLGVLSPHDLHFFYYDVGLDSLTGNPVIYERNKEIEEFLGNSQLVVKPVEENQLSNQAEDNKIFFTIDSKKDTTADDAFFRHLRNAFAHYRICRQGNYYYMRDYRGKKKLSLTMIGKVKCKDLEKLCFLFKKQCEMLDKNIHSINDQEL